jgi:hypothetical protein
MLKRLIELFIPFFEFFVFGNLFVALGALCQVCLSYQITGIPLNLKVGSIVFLSTFCTYTFSLVNFKWQSIKSDGSSRQNFIAKHYSLLKILVILSFLGLVFLSLSLSKKTILLLAFEAILAFLYTQPLLFYQKKLISLRMISGLKIWIISFLWAITCVIIPWLESIPQKLYSSLPLSSLISSLVGIHFSETFLMIFSMCLLFDIRDWKQDQLRKTITLVGIFGIKTSKYLAVTLLGICIVLNAYINSKNQLTAWSFNIPIIILILLAYFSNPKKSDYYFMLGVDGILISQFLLVFAGQILFRHS